MGLLVDVAFGSTRTKTLIYKASLWGEKETGYYCHHGGQCKVKWQGSDRDTVV